MSDTCLENGMKAFSFFLLKYYLSNAVTINPTLISDHLKTPDHNANLTRNPDMP